MKNLLKYTVIVAVIALMASAGYGHAFSVDNLVIRGNSVYLPGDILTPGPSLHIGMPLQSVVGGPIDNLNALSGGLDTYAENPVIFFSVCRATQGMPGNPAIPFVSDVAVEAAGMQAAGDVFVTTTSHIHGALIPPQWAAPQGYNMLHINQTELGLLPVLFPTQPNQNPAIDDLDALNFSEFDLNADGILDQSAYFSLDLQSPTVSGGGGFITADDILLLAPGAGAPVVFADGMADIGLMPGDDLDALVLMDLVNPGIADAGIDKVLFSLAPGSPTLAANGWSAADLLTSDFAGNITVAYTAASLGLLETDNLDALEIQPGVVPEPGTMFLLGTACIAGLGYVRRRRMN